MKFDSGTCYMRACDLGDKGPLFDSAVCCLLGHGQSYRTSNSVAKDEAKTAIPIVRI